MIGPLTEEESVGPFDDPLSSALERPEMLRAAAGEIRKRAPAWRPRG
jgi:hypothetical protein